MTDPYTKKPWVRDARELAYAAIMAGPDCPGKQFLVDLQEKQRLRAAAQNPVEAVTAAPAELSGPKQGLSGADIPDGARVPAENTMPDTEFWQLPPEHDEGD